MDKVKENIQRKFKMFLINNVIKNENATCFGPIFEPVIPKKQIDEIKR